LPVSPCEAAIDTERSVFRRIKRFGFSCESGGRLMRDWQRTPHS
jgi:hypothetical protein